MQFYDFCPPKADLKQEVLQGLTAQPKTIPPKFFYDDQGSRLFDAITELPEYYPTRTEIGILQDHGEEIAEHLGHDCLLMELGSGSSRKIRILLDVLKPAAYIPIDISREHLLQSARKLAMDYPELEIHAACADFSKDIELPYDPPTMPRVAFFPGSSIGNFEPTQATNLLQRIAGLLGSGGTLLIGADLKKDTEVLDAAYNDEQGVTADFNLNLLERINRELSANFQLEQFAHFAFYNELRGRVEMHLVSQIAQEIRIDGQSFRFGAGETIHTENSYKYTVEQFHQLTATAGFITERVWTDTADLFSVHCLRIPG